MNASAGINVLMLNREVILVAVIVVYNVTKYA